jgi:hypothetical protein
MKQELESHDEYLLRLKMHGPSDFDDARQIKETFVDLAQSAMASSNVHETRFVLNELHEVDQDCQCATSISKKSVIDVNVNR